MAIQTIDALVNSLPGQYLPFVKNPTTVSSAYVSTWMASGLPGAGAAPAGGINGEIPTDATAGAFPFTNPTGGNLSYLGRLAGVTSSACTILVYDRLWHNTITVTSTTAQTVSMPALTRPDALGEDVELWFQTYSAMGAAAPSVSVSYTNSSGVSGRTATVTAISSAAVNRALLMSLPSGDTGVRSVQSVTLGASYVSGTAGLVLRRRIATIPLAVGGVGNFYGPLDIGLPRIYDDACLEFVVQGSASGSLLTTGEMVILQG